MQKRLVSGTIILLLSLTAFGKTESDRRSPQPTKLFLRKGWSIQSSAQIKEKGDAISENAFQPKNWYAATVPSTVVGTLVEDKVYPDPLVDKNLRLIPGCSYPIGANFSNLPMPEDSPFPRFLVVSNTVSYSGKLSRQECLAEFRWHQLSSKHLAQWSTDCHLRSDSRDLSHA